MTEIYLDLPNMIKYYGDARVIEAKDDDLSERSTISQMPLNFGLITEFRNQGDLTADKVIFVCISSEFESYQLTFSARFGNHASSASISYHVNLASD